MEENKDQEITKEQKIALERIRDRYQGSKIADPIKSFDNCLMVKIEYKNGGSIWLGIELDGYTHS